jgi:4'-phosphopantetheinyl transferase
MADQVWRPPPDHLPQKKDQVHVWRVVLDQPGSHVQDLQRTLTDDERVRAKQFHFGKHRDRFIVARAMLRVILGRYLDIAPGEVQFCYNPYGKPALAHGSGAAGLRFNLSHSHRVALYAVTCGREVGVDIEYIQPAVTEEGIAERFFSPREVIDLRALPPRLQTRAFFACWTRKEAFIKANGKGLSMPLDQFDVSVNPEEPAALLSVNGASRQASHWRLQDIPVGDGFAAAIAVEGHAWRMKCWQYEVQSPAANGSA